MTHRGGIRDGSRVVQSSPGAWESPAPGHSRTGKAHLAAEHPGPGPSSPQTCMNHRGQHRAVCPGRAALRDHGSHREQAAVGTPGHCCVLCCPTFAQGSCQPRGIRYVGLYKKEEEPAANRAPPAKPKAQMSDWATLRPGSNNTVTFVGCGPSARYSANVYIVLSRSVLFTEEEAGMTAGQRGSAADGPSGSGDT